LPEEPKKEHERLRNVKEEFDTLNAQALKVQEKLKKP